MAKEKEVKEVKDEKTREKNVWDVLVHPHLAEKSMNMVEIENKLVFIVDRRADKKTIKEVIEKEFNVKVDSVRTEMTTRGQKKAYVKVNPEFSAADIASKFGMI
ncbi:MAG: 50S ribosomal protein L23 [Candidatus Aenigmarchaeota archaeon]|nr:50S ribosomal protein L23 [Candidatus Aenigmarchaeota archaeon]NIP41026.1 50S ribosomal protein L23 [Candidatus Aenigmarchaeota archaeon]NIQ17428.1 50S ribosomal protein L23 [Candidatus Aenigmarchaeota archaeon]NIS73622.1 50S ribosomal protein L23 [Candidatus Aenigmarchaeota archaeon]